MKTIIAGPRDHDDYVSLLVSVHLAPWVVSEVVSGHARGVDTMGERWSREALGREPKLFPADWNRWGNAAGPKRNRQMAEYADAAILLWFGKYGTPGTKNMLKQAKAHGLKVFVYKVNRSANDSTERCIRINC